MKLIGIRTGIYIVIMVTFLVILNSLVVPTYSPNVSKNNFDEKLKGTYLLNSSPENNVIYLGASELNTKQIQSHPSNFYSDENEFLVNTVGRGSCQAIVYASILASIEDIASKKIVITLSPQNFVEGGIASDMYFANFSPLQYMEIQNSSLSENIKNKFLNRFEELDKQYVEKTGDRSTFATYRILNNAYLSENLKDKVVLTILKPFIYLNNEYLKLSDKTKTYIAIKNLESYGSDRPIEIDYEVEKENMVEFGKVGTSNNEFYMDNDYYNVNIGQRVDRFEDKDIDVKYDDSIEYSDVELLLEIAKERGIEPMIFVHPFHAKWSDYTGIDIETRYDYYNKIDELLKTNNANYVNLSDMEYVDYYMCDVLHYGWLGWLDVDKRISEFYYEN